ncbi:MAG: GxxExxY protein [Muribaculaceae bacterium]|nr:GxxExxY protein [Muribaculaceae bacterium]
MNADYLNRLSKEIIGAAIEVHSYFGPGLLENIYRDALVHELSLRNIEAHKEVIIPCNYKGVKLDIGFRADVVVQDSIIVELKATQEDHPIFTKQLFTYLKVTDKKLGLLINFNRNRLIDGVTRIVNNFPE